MQQLKMNNREELRLHLLTKEDEPIVFHDMMADWPASHWTPQTLADILQNQTLTFRVGRRNFNGVEWENDCAYTDATIAELNAWLDGHSTDVNPLRVYTRDAHWAYADYKYMANIFKDKPDILKCVDWSGFGFDGRDGTDSTFWFGTRGANTVCHYDTYGCNLVAQIYGRKRWVLFPPTDTECLYPTRIPYEESSVFSQVNITAPDLGRFPKYKSATPYVVTLCPSDVLYVPHHWWHYVESLDTSISVNTWIDMDVDKNERFQEAVTRTLVFMLMSQSESGDELDSWLNDTEAVTSHVDNLGFIRSAAAPFVNSASAGKYNSHLASCDITNDHQHVDKKSRTELTESDLMTSGQDCASIVQTVNRRANGGGVIDCNKAFDSVIDKLTAEHVNNVCAYHIERVNQFTLSELLYPDAPAGPCARLMQDDGSTSSLTDSRTDCESVTTGKPVVSDLDMSDVVEAVLHPDVVKLITEKLANKFNLNANL